MIISSVLSVIVAYLGRKITKENERRDEIEKAIADEELALKNGIRSILRDRILHVCSACENRNSITIEELENITDLYQSYTHLGGNGAITKIYNDTIKLPLKKENKEE